MVKEESNNVKGAAAGLFYGIDINGLNLPRRLKIIMEEKEDGRLV